MRVLVCGSRSFGEKDTHARQMDQVLRDLPPDATIVHGDARGADRMAGTWARENGRHEERHPANWEKHGKAAGPIRNSEMLRADLDRVIAFWDGKSKGTKDMIDKAKRSYVGENNVMVIFFDVRPCTAGETGSKS